MVQGARPLTVGDTTTLMARVAVPADAMVQPRIPVDSALVTMLGPPTLRRDGDTVQVTWPVTLWAPGQHVLSIPGLVVVRPGQAPDTLADFRVPLDVASVIPAQVSAESLPPRPPREWVPDGEVSLVPLAVLLPPVLVGLALWHWWWRRRGPRPVAPVVPALVRLDADRVERWLAAGEGRLLLRHLEAALPATDAATAWRARVAAVRYAPGASEEILALAHEGWALYQAEAR